MSKSYPGHFHLASLFRRFQQLSPVLFDLVLEVAQVDDRANLCQGCLALAIDKGPGNALQLGWQKKMRRKQTVPQKWNKVGKRKMPSEDWVRARGINLDFANGNVLLRTKEKGSAWCFTTLSNTRSDPLLPEFPKPTWCNFLSAQREVQHQRGLRWNCPLKLNETQASAFTCTSFLNGKLLLGRENPTNVWQKSYFLFLFLLPCLLESSLAKCQVLLSDLDRYKFILFY